MKNAFTLLGLLVCSNIWSQQVMQIRGVGQVTAVFDQTYYQTTLDWNGLKMTAMGTAKNITNAANFVGGVAGQIGNIFNSTNQAPVIVTDGDVTYYNYQDKIITEEKKYVRGTSVTVGIEAGAYHKIGSIAAGLRNSKYKYIAPDFYLDAKVRPMWLFVKARDLFTGFTYFRENAMPVHVQWLGLFSLGYQAGNDMGMPGFLNFAEKSYQGITIGVGDQIKRIAWTIEGFIETKPSDLNQTNVRFGIAVKI
jgi:hypothetical protein